MCWWAWGCMPLFVIVVTGQLASAPTRDPTPWCPTPMRLPPARFPFHRRSPFCTAAPLHDDDATLALQVQPHTHKETDRKWRRMARARCIPYCYEWLPRSTCKLWAPYSIMHTRAGLDHGRFLLMLNGDKAVHTGSRRGRMACTYDCTRINLHLPLEKKNWFSIDHGKCHILLLYISQLPTVVLPLLLMRAPWTAWDGAVLPTPPYPFHECVVVCAADHGASCAASASPSGVAIPIPWCRCVNTWRCSCVAKPAGGRCRRRACTAGTGCHTSSARNRWARCVSLLSLRVKLLANCTHGHGANRQQGESSLDAPCPRRRRRHA